MPQIQSLATSFGLVQTQPFAPEELRSWVRIPVAADFSRGQHRRLIKRILNMTEVEDYGIYNLLYCHIRTGLKQH